MVYICLFPPAALNRFRNKKQVLFVCSVVFKIMSCPHMTYIVGLALKKKKTVTFKSTPAAQKIRAASR